MKPLRIAMLATPRSPLVTPFAGGQESRTHAVVQGLRARGHHVHLWAAPGTPPESADAVHAYACAPAFSEQALFDLAIPEPPFLDDHAASVGAWREIHTDTRGFDVIHSQSLHYLPLALSATTPIPFVTTLHTPPYPWMELGAATASASTHYVFVSEFQRRGWQTITGNSRVIAGGVDPHVFTLGAGGSGGLWAGRITPEKAPHIAITWARAAGISLRLAGPIADHEYFARHVAPHLGDAVTYAGHLDTSELAKTYGAHDVLLVTPDWDEPFGLTAIEAGMCGTTVVATPRGALGDVLATGIGEVVRDSDAAGAVARALTADRHQVRRAAVKHFSCERMIDAYERVYADAVGAAGA